MTTEVGERTEASEHTILIVENNAQLAETYQAWFARWDDITTIVAQRGRDAVEYASEEIDAIVLDRRLPDVSGGELLNEFDDPRPAVVVISGHPPDAELPDEAVDSYLTKPVPASKIDEAIHTVLNDD